MKKRHNLQKKWNNHGFTLVEMAVTLTIVSLVLAVTFVGLRAWMRNSEFKKANEYAHTIYTAASLELSNLELSGEREDFTKRVCESGEGLETIAQLGAGAPEEVYEETRIVAISAKAGEYEAYQNGGEVSKEAELVFELIEPYSYDTSVCNLAITLEYDSYTHSVYAVFVSTRATAFVYEDLHGADVSAYDEQGTVSLNAAADYENNRSYDTRKELLLGYYCVDELGVAAVFGDGRLRVTDCLLDNDETLDLVVTSTSRHGEADVAYTATIYESRTDGDSPLFEVSFSLMDLYGAGYTAAEAQTMHTVELSVHRYSGGVREEKAEMYEFPLYFINGQLHLTLDAVMSAQTESAMAAALSAADAQATSFARFLSDKNALPDIYASVRVQQLTESDLPIGYDESKTGVRLWINEEDYIVGSSVVSNTENAYFASATETSADIAAMRHLSNIRRVNTNASMSFYVTDDLYFADAVIYDQKDSVMEPMEYHTTKAFPMIERFSSFWSLSGEGLLGIGSHTIDGLVLTEESIVGSKDTCFGILGTNAGTIKELAFTNTTALLGYEKTTGEDFTRQSKNSTLLVRAAGVICGLNEGSITGISLDDATRAHIALNYKAPAGASVDMAGELSGIGMICGVHDGNRALTDIETAGELEGYFYDINDAGYAAQTGEDDVCSRFRYAGIGGVCGFTLGRAAAGAPLTAIGEEAKVVEQIADFLHLTEHYSVINSASVSGNAFVGGISGNGAYASDVNVTINEVLAPLIDNCSSKGLIHLSGEPVDLVACGTENAAYLEAESAHTNADNCFGGGIIGYLKNGRVRDCAVSSGNSDEVFLEAAVDTTPSGVILANGQAQTRAHAFLSDYMTGNYVGGIAGCVVEGQLQNCETKEGGYVLGNDEVGGIVGYLATISTESDRLTMTGSKELENNCYVIGHSNVGGIIGSNHAGTTLCNCINEGIVVGSGINIGGIAGSNCGDAQKEACIENCTSEVFDYDNSSFTLVAEVWQIYGDNVGGLVGYNKYGSITRTDKAKTNISSIVVGDDNVGGVFGYADEETTFAFTDYTMDGIEVYATGDAAGGYIGKNVSATALPDKSYEVRPYLVQGENYVGGAIGLNEVAADKVLLSNTNAFGTVSGMRFVGGIIGYQNGRLTITGENASGIIAGSYGGGILGYGASKNIAVKDCKNTGDISDLAAAAATDEQIKLGSISLRDLYEGNTENGTPVILSESDYSYESLKEALGSTDEEMLGSFVGGIVGFLPKGSVADSCTQSGMIYANNGFGGIAGISLGTLKNCKVESNLGTQESTLAGGLASINGESARVKVSCVGAKNADYTIEGKSIVGGLFAINAATNADSAEMYANINGALDGYGVGGLCGILLGSQRIDTPLGADASLEIGGGEALGGIVGVMAGTLQTDAENLTDKALRVNGTDAVGGIFGVLDGGKVVDADGEQTAYKNAASVTANDGCAGGIVGLVRTGTINLATNLTDALVTAYGTDGYAGGIVALVEEGGSVLACENKADVISMNSYAGGICAWNKGTLEKNTFMCTQKQTISSDADSMGIIAAVNDGTIISCAVEADDASKDEPCILLHGNGSIIGGIVGTNTGDVTDSQMKVSYELETAATDGLTIGGAIGMCDWTKYNKVENVKVKDYSITLEGNCAYFGGLIGRVSGAGIVSKSKVSDLTLKELDASLKGSCYGGLIGANTAKVNECTVKNISAAISGLYQANITLNAKLQEQLAGCLGGMVGKNETTGQISACTLDTADGYDKNQIVVENGFVGGITGINKGELTTSGYLASEEDSAVAIAEGVQKAIEKYETDNKGDVHTDLETGKKQAGYEYLIDTNKTVKSMIKNRLTAGISDLQTMLSKDSYNDQTIVTWMKENTEPTLLLQLTGNGSVGGITAYNTADGEMGYCVSGHWLIDNRSSSQHSAQGGVIGTNESDHDTYFLINQAMVLRESPSGVTERVNGGVIGYQHNTTSSNWTIYGCINTGMVVNANSHYSGGIIGRWSDQGGSIEYCRNYGVLQTSFQAGYKGAAGGIASQLYHPLDEQSYTILSCRNDGSIFGTGEKGRDSSLCANDSGGILGNIVTYQAENKSQAQSLQVNIVDCVNSEDVTIVAGSMCSGIITLLTSDKAASNDEALSNLELNIDRCRNYATDFVSVNGLAGIFSDRGGGHENTRITNCFTVAVDSEMAGAKNYGYICYDGDGGGDSYKYDGGKSAICYNNHVLLVNADGDAVDESVKLDLGSAKASDYSYGYWGVSGTVYPVLESGQRGENLGGILSSWGGWQRQNYTVSGTHEGTQLYIQLDQPVKLGELTLQFGSSSTHSCRVEYLVDASTGGSFTLAKESICVNSSTETVSFPKNVKIYALRIQYVENGINKASSFFQQYGYYYSERSTEFALKALTLTQSGGSKIALSAGESITSSRLVDREVVTRENYSNRGNRKRNASTQYLFVSNKNGKTLLIEPQFESTRLSASADNRKDYAKIDNATIIGSEIFKTTTTGSGWNQQTTYRPYGSIYATASGNLTSGKIDYAALDSALTDHYKGALSAAMPYEEGSNLPETPTEATVKIDNDSASVKASWKNSIDGARNVVKYYLVTLAASDGTSYVTDKKCFGNTLTLPITEEMYNKKLKVSVRAVNENGTSDVYISGESEQIKEPMLTPSIRLELVESGNTYKYEISLENLKDYKQKYGSNWQVDVYRQGDKSETTKLCTFTKSNTTKIVVGGEIKKISDGNYSPSLAIWQLYAQASSKDKTLLSSEQYETSVYTPKYGNAIPEVQTLYASFDDNYESELDAKINVYIASDTSRTGIYPLYQVDLIRVDTAGKEHILAAKELAVSDQISRLTFTELPSEFFDNKETQYFYVRAWVSQTGVGPVYTWHETDQLEKHGSLAVDTTEEDKSFITGVILENASDFGNRIVYTNKDGGTASLSGENEAAIAAQASSYAMTNRPTMNAKTDVTASYDVTSDELSYTFTWHDKSKETTSYELRIYGVGEGGDRVLLEQQYPIERTGDETSYTYEADDVTFDKLQLVVIQRDTGYAPGDSGEHENKGKVVPRVLIKDISIRTRLQKLSQPSVKLIDQNDLNYRISWQDLSARVEESKRDELRYALYIKTGDETTLLEKTQEHTIECDFESYAGKTVQLYVVAYVNADDLKNSKKVDLTNQVSFKSKIGLKKRIAVASRLEAPQLVENAYGWSYRDAQIDLNEEAHVLSEEQFVSNALKLDLTFGETGNYVMNAVCFDSKSDAETFITNLKGTPYERYVSLEKILSDANYRRISSGERPIMLNLKNKSQRIYTAAPSFSDISYAGGYLVPLVRATSSTDISSYWTCGEPCRIPRVRLNTPTLTATSSERTYETFGENLRTQLSESGEPFTNVTVYYETYRFCVPSYVKENVLTLSGANGVFYELTIKDDQVIVETAEDTKTYRILGEQECSIDAIESMVSGTYRAGATYRAAYRMTLTCGIRRFTEDGKVIYELRLPQTRAAITADGNVTISGTSRLITDIWIQAIPEDESRYVKSAGQS